MAAPRDVDLIAIGRSSVDLYGQQVGGRLEDMTSFAKYLGGSPANTAVGGARLGLRTALATRVGDDHMGRFLREQLVREGVDVSGVATDPERLTALVVLGIQDRETFPLIFYRENCADMALSAADIPPELLGGAGAVLVNGTHLSQPGVFDVSLGAARACREAGGRVVFDIDYRPVLWGLAGRDRGEDRFVADAAVTARLQQVTPLCDLIVGTEEEFRILGGHDDVAAALAAVRATTGALLVCKRGPQGCVAFEGDVDGWDSGLSAPGFPVEVFNVLGAGDAFMAGFLRGWLRDEPLEVCCRWANACGAIVVSRHGCAPAMATWPELQAFLAREPVPARLREDAELEHLHWATTRRPASDALMVLAIDHRAQLEELADGLGAPRERLARFKSLALDALERVADGRPEFGVLLDGRYGADALAAATTRGACWVGRPIEAPKSRPLEFEGGADVGVELAGWPAGQTVKCLAFYHPDDDEEMRGRQERQVLRLFEACRATGHELLLEIILPRTQDAAPDTVARAMRRLYGLGVRPDWWKLEPMSDPRSWRAIEAAVADCDPLCRGVVLLGLSAPHAELVSAFAAAAPFPVVKGFAVGRTIFFEPARAWLSGEADDPATVDALASRFAALVETWRALRGRREAAA